MGLESSFGGDGQSCFSVESTLVFCGLTPLGSELISTFFVEPKSRFGGGGGGTFFSDLGS